MLKAMCSLVLLMGLVAQSCYAAENIISDDGREIRIKNDGTWEYRSDDKFATLEDGRRIRLKADGSWLATEDRVIVKELIYREELLEVTVDKLVFEINRKKGHKGDKIKTQTVFYLDVALSAEAQEPQSINQSSLNNFQLEDSNGRQYPILMARADAESIAPGELKKMVVRADGMPHWAGKTLMLNIHKSVFGSRRDIELSKSMDFARRQQVKDFKYDHD